MGNYIRCSRAHEAAAVFLGLLLVLAVADKASAVPAAPGGVAITQPDGSVFELRRHGDEFFSWDETADGEAVLKDETDGFWKYAQPARDRAAYTIIPGARVGKADPAQYKIKKHALPDAQRLKFHIQEQVRKRRGVPVELPAPAGSPVTGSMGISSIESPPPSQMPVSGTKTVKNIVILACFSDHWDSSGATVLASKGRVAVSEYSNLFNTVGYTTDGAVGSVRDYYNEVSYNKLTIDTAVTPWVRLPQNEAYYGTGNPDAHADQMVADAISAAATAGFNFSSGDSDSDGWADCLTILHSGYGQEYSGNPSTCIWSHQGGMAAVVTNNGVKMYRYHTEPALRGWTTDPVGITRIGVICHEMGHFFGLPDLYDYSATTYGVGYWSLMAKGSWNGTYGTRPAHFDAWSKGCLGFVNPVLVHSQAGLSLARVEDGSVVKLLRDGMSNGEYFLMENRAKTGFDNDVNIFPGMLIYHVYSKSANNDLNTWAHPLVKIEEADGDNSLGAKASYSEAGDVWTSSSGLSGGFKDQTVSQSANAMLYQSAAYNRSDLSSYYTYNLLGSFSAAGNLMTCDVTSLKTAVGSQAVAVPDYTVAWNACSQASKYELQEGARATLASFSDGAEDEDAMYENWGLAGAVQRSTAGKRSGSCSYLMQWYDGNSNWYTSVQSTTLRKPFKVKSTTVISFYLMSHLASGTGYLKCQISNDSGTTWKTLATYDGYIDPWSSRTYNYTAMNAQGINTDDVCILRFIANFERASYYLNFPAAGFAVDDISITGTEMAGYGGWTTLDNNIATTSYNVTGKSSGLYAYRVRAYANSVWQGYGPEGEVTVARPQVQLTVASAFGNALPAVGTVTYDSDSSIACLVTNSPATMRDNYSIVTAVCTGWTGTGSAPLLGGTTNTGAFPITMESSVTWRWLATALTVSNQVVNTATNLAARDMITAQNGYQLQGAADVNLQVGSTGTVVLGDGFDAPSGSTLKTSTDFTP